MEGIDVATVRVGKVAGAARGNVGEVATENVDVARVRRGSVRRIDEDRVRKRNVPDHVNVDLERLNLKIDVVDRVIENHEIRENANVEVAAKNEEDHHVNAHRHLRLSNCHFQRKPDRLSDLAITEALRLWKT